MGVIRHAKWTGIKRVKVENGVDAGLQVDLARLLFETLL
jgi:hypothetical protein